MQQPAPSRQPSEIAWTAQLARRRPAWAERLGLLGVVLLPALVPWNGKFSDLDIYYDWATQALAGRVPYRDFALEYPPAALALFALPRALFDGRRAYAVAFMALMVGFDLAQKRLIWLRGGPRRGVALALHSACGAALYFTYLKRFDVALACVMALGWDALWQAPRNARSWGYWAAGALLKGIPALLGPLWIWQAWRRGGSGPRACLGAAGGVGGALAVLGGAALWAGPAAWSWLTYHEARGLQVGSTYTAVALLRSGLGKPLDSAFIYGASHLVGPWSEQAARLSPRILGAAVGFTSLRMVPGMRHEAGHWRAATAVLIAVLLTSKVYSPQFTAWLLPFAALAAVRGARLDWPLMAGLLALALLTAEVFPGEGAMLAGALRKQVALVARSGVLALLWGYLLATPGGLNSRRLAR